MRQHGRNKRRRKRFGALSIHRRGKTEQCPPNKTKKQRKKEEANLSLDVLAVLHVALARELAEPAPAVGTRY